ncbi:hypothetical protein F5I97DRAFT_1827735 [Phlebopus sp. FC_14]|nr:hypothetical protein F5I97DRAFT_1827735 [Phlebopus sp. FC_14]
MRLTFSHSDYMNTDISDEQGRLLYRINTPFAWKNQKTTVTKYAEKTQQPEELAVIEWKWLKNPVIHFKGNTVAADDLLTTRSWSSGRYFKGPDGRMYKWKIQTTNCWLKLEDSDLVLAKYHDRNFGIRKSSHPPYLEISSSVTHMLDELITTFIYAEKLSLDAQASASAAA